MLTYTTKENIETYLGISIDDSLDQWVDSLIDSCSKVVEGICNRKFTADTAFVTRYYNGNGCTRVFIDDLIEIESLALDDETLSANLDFFLYPLNAAANGEPFNSIEMALPISTSQSNPRANMRTGTLTEGQRNIAISGKFGYATSVPSTIQFAVTKLAGSIIKENISDTDLKEITSETIGQYSASYAKIKDVAYTMEIAEMVSQYIRKDKYASSGIMLLS